MTARALRADAERNRLRVLDVAQEVFAAEGLSVPIDVIARRAGLGVGTLYRHFPTKEALFEAIVVGRLEQLAQAARDGAKTGDPGEAFFAFLARTVEDGRAKKDFIAALASTGVDMKRIAAAKQGVGRAMAALLARAQRAGAVRRDVRVLDVWSLMMAAMSAGERPGATAADRRRVLSVVCDGLKAGRGP